MAFAPLENYNRVFVSVSIDFPSYRLRKEINRLLSKGIIRLRKEINMLLSNSMSNIYLKVTI